MTDGNEDIEYDQDLMAFEYLNEGFEREDIVATELDEVEEDPSLAKKEYEGVDGAKTVDIEEIKSATKYLKTKLQKKTVASNSHNDKGAEHSIDDFFEVDDTKASPEDSFSNVLSHASMMQAPPANDLFPLPATSPPDSLPHVENTTNDKRITKDPPRKGDKRRRRGSKAVKMPPLDLKKAHGAPPQKQPKQEAQVGGKEHTRRRKLDLRKRREVELAAAKVCVMLCCARQSQAGEGRMFGG